MLDRTLVSPVTLSFSTVISTEYMAGTQRGQRALQRPRPSPALALRLAAGRRVAVALWCSAGLSRTQWCSAGFSGVSKAAARSGEWQRRVRHPRHIPPPGTQGTVAILVLLASPYLHGCCGSRAEPCPSVQPVSSAGHGAQAGSQVRAHGGATPTEGAGAGTAPLPPYGMGDSWHLSFLPVPASSGVPSALCMVLSSEDPKTGSAPCWCCGLV